METRLNLWQSKVKNTLNYFTMGEQTGPEPAFQKKKKKKNPIMEKDR